MTSTLPAGDYFVQPGTYRPKVERSLKAGGQAEDLSELDDDQIHAWLAEAEQPNLSMAAMLGELTDERIAEWIASLPGPTLGEVARKEWWFVSRPEQQEPAGDWAIWLIMAGRGWGKTRTGAEWLIDRILENPVDVDGHATEWAAVGESLQDGRRILVEGPSGLLNVMRRRGIRFQYVKSPSPHLVLRSGQKIHILGAHDKDTGRGYNLAGAWLDEIAKWPYPSESWTEGLAPALRVKTPGNAKPRVVVTTTPKPTPLLFDWTRRKDGSVHITRGSTFDNAANLAPSAVSEFVRLYGNSRIGRQELYAELLEDVEGALWSVNWIEDNRVDLSQRGVRLPEMRLKVVAVDPAVTVTESSDETGIVAAGLGVDGFEYVLGDRSAKVAGKDAARRAWRMWRDLDCDLMVFEDNQGKEFVREILADEWTRLQEEDPEWPRGDAPLESVTARRGKRLRAEPVAARYQNNRVRHVGVYPKMESQLTEWIPDQGQSSPDRLDALVYALTRLHGKIFDGTVTGPVVAPVDPRPAPQDDDQARLRKLLERAAGPQAGRIRR